jgi:hypothetical protein
MFFPKGLPLAATYSVFLVLLFSAGASLWLGYWIPLCIGLAYMVFLYRKATPKKLLNAFSM